MNPKTIFLIIISVLITIVLMKNTDEINFWFFGETSISKLAVLSVMFFTGAVVGFMLGRPQKKHIKDEDIEEDEASLNKPHTPFLSEEDRDYIS
jgi:anaerobic C4-dicarboxylate transporter